jgi:hypothetical protein
MRCGKLLFDGKARDLLNRGGAIFGREIVREDEGEVRR